MININFKFLVIFIFLFLKSSYFFAQSIDYVDNNFMNVNFWNDYNSKKWINYIDTSNYNLLLIDTSTISGTDFISKQINNLVPETGTIEWNFNIQTSVNNSSTNNWKIILISNDTLPQTSNFKGLGIGTGLKTGDYSQLCLLEFDGKNTNILATTNLFFKSKSNNININISRTSNGIWSLNDSIIYSELNNNIYIANWFSVIYKHNKYGHNAFSVYVSKFNFNLTGNTFETKFDSVEIIDNKTINAYFNGRINLNSVYNLKNYSINGHNPDSVKFYNNYISLFLNPKSLKQTELSLKINNLLHVDNSLIKPYDTTIYFADFGDIVINEIMCDIDPKPFGLPTVKYIELFNTTDQTFNLTNYSFYLGSYSFLFPKISLHGGEYLILSKYDSLSTYGKIVNYKDDTKLILSNRTLQLLTPFDFVVDSVTYNKSMYNNSEKSSGGYSIERINPYKNLPNNWKASINWSGGTPGVENSNFSILDNNDDVFENSKNDISIINELFKPNSDYDNNELQIVFNYDSDEYFVDIKIFDSNGILKKVIAVNQNISSNQIFSWNGKNDNENLCLSGIYVVYIRVYKPNGYLKEYKKTCVISNGL
ncbi:MAG: lamin tail domain-containing protein [Bacteroidales bacterium]|nr:lamin tail domain-containing protein [Bacteroidales bacterium]